MILTSKVFEVMFGVRLR